MRPRNKEHMFALGKMFCTEKISDIFIGAKEDKKLWLQPVSARTRQIALLQEGVLNACISLQVR